MDFASSSSEEPRRSDRQRKAKQSSQQQQEQKQRKPSKSQTRKRKQIAPVDKVKEAFKAEILKEYKIIKKTYDEMVKTDGLKSFQFHLNDSLPTQPEIVPLPQFPEQHDAQNTVNFYGSKKEKIQLSATSLDDYPKIPSMSTYYHIDKNIHGSDQLCLTNFPYLNDGAAADRKVLKQIELLYPEGVHGNDRGCNLPLNDYLLYNVSEPILQRHGWKDNEEDIIKFMGVMRELFPMKGLSVKDLVKSYESTKKMEDERKKVNEAEKDVLAEQNDTVESKNDKENILDIIESAAKLGIEVLTSDIVSSSLCAEYPCSSDTIKWTGEEKSYFDLFPAFKYHPHQVTSENDKQEKLEKRLITITTKHRNEFRRNYYKTTFNNRKSYQPCKHSGACTIENGCSCKRRKTACTKFCQCPDSCTSRFPGCNCAVGRCGTNSCDCFMANWECDPDTCKRCNCDGDGTDGKPLCQNIKLQRSMGKKLFLQHSTIAGTGCFAGENIQTGEYIGEYTGEIISDDEAERRGIIYDARKCSYLFDINKDQSIDATRYGNHTRFINHSNTPNCHPKILIVNAQHKIGFYASQNIKSGKELFFDYDYNNGIKKIYNFVESK